MKQGISDNEKVGLGHGEVPVEDLDELALDPADVALAKRAGDHRPVDVFQSRVVGVLGGNDESAEEHAVKSPLLGLHGEIRSGASDVDECGEDVGGSDFGSLDNVPNKLVEL